MHTEGPGKLWKTTFSVLYACCYVSRTMLAAVPTTWFQATTSAVVGDSFCVSIRYS